LIAREASIIDQNIDLTTRLFFGRLGKRFNRNGFGKVGRNNQNYQQDRDGGEKLAPT